jgi:hypothetical protein
MNKTIVIVGIIVAILGLGCVGGSLYTTTQTETYTEMVPTTRDITVQEQVPKTREVEKQKTQTVRENVPMFKEKTEEKVIFDLQFSPGFEQWALVDYTFETKNAVKFVIKQPAISTKGQRYWYISFNGISTKDPTARMYRSYVTYYHERPNVYLCYYKNWEDDKCAKQENLNPDEFIIIFDPQKLENEEMRERFKTQKFVVSKLFFRIMENKGGEWQGIPLKSEDASKIPYLEVHLFDHYEMQNVQKLVTYKETETYYVTENVTKQEEYQKEETKTHEVKVRPYLLGLWVGIGLLAVAIVLIALGSRKSGAEQVAPAPTEKFCPKCGRENSAESVFCTNCGTQLK